MEEHWTLHTLGCRGSWPVSGAQYLEFGGGTTCYILKRGEYAAIIDCGSGLYNAKELLRDCRAVDVLLTHLHYDHIIGLMGGGVFPQGARVRYLGEFDRWFGQESLSRFLRPPFWPVTPDFGELVTVASPGEVELRPGLRARFHPSFHPDGASMIRLDCDGGGVCAAFDYEHCGPFPEEMARGCQVLLYDGMYTREEYPLHVGWGHSCWQEGCALANRLEIPQPVITHHSPDRDDRELREMEAEAQKCCPRIRFARAGDKIEIYHSEEDAQ